MCMTKKAKKQVKKFDVTGSYFRMGDTVGYIDVRNSADMLLGKIVGFGPKMLKIQSINLPESFFNKNPKSCLRIKRIR